MKSSKLFVACILFLLAISCSKKEETDDEPSSEKILFIVVDDDYKSLVGAGGFDVDSMFLVAAGTSDTIMPISKHDTEAQLDSSRNPDYSFRYAKYFEDVFSFYFEHIGPGAYGPTPNIYYLILNNTEIDTILVEFNDCEAEQSGGKSEGICVSFNNSIAPLCDTCTESYIKDHLLFIKEE